MAAGPSPRVPPRPRQLGGSSRFQIRAVPAAPADPVSDRREVRSQLSDRLKQISGFGRARLSLYFSGDRALRQPTFTFAGFRLASEVAECALGVAAQDRDHQEDSRYREEGCGPEVADEHAGDRHRQRERAG